MGDPERAGDEPDVAGVEASVAEEVEAVVLDGVAQGVDGVVVVDHPLRAGEVGRRARASVPAAIALVVSDARRTTPSVRSRSCASRAVVFTCFIIDGRGARARVAVLDCLPVVHLRATARPLPRYEPSVPSALR